MTNAIKGVPYNDLPAVPTQGINYDDLFSHIIEAHTSLARLDETLRHLRNPKIIEYAFLTREAVLSSQIEGTQATLEDVFKEEAITETKLEETTKRLQDIREVTNYRRALRKGVTFIDEGRALSENIVKELHKILLSSVRGRTKSPGEFRKSQVHIAPPGTPIEDASYVPPSPQNIPSLYSNFDKYYNDEKIEKDLLVQLAISHYQFEAIHPFNDGNGRIGRILIPLFLYKRKIISYPYMYISKYFEKHRRDYYDLLSDVSYKKEWTKWIRFFLNGISEQAKEASQLTGEIVETQQKFHAILSKFKSPYALNLLDALFENPICSTTKMKEAANIPNVQTVIDLVKKFVVAEILVDLSPEKKRNKIYGFLPLLNILNKEYLEK